MNTHFNKSQIAVPLYYNLLPACGGCCVGDTKRWGAHRSAYGGDSANATQDCYGYDHHGARHPDMAKRSEDAYILTCNVSLEYEKRLAR